MLPSEIKTEAQIKEAITAVIVFFDLFDYPLSDYEIWKYLDKKIDFLELKKALSILNEIENQDGFFFLSGRSEIIISRKKRHNYTQRKIKIAKRFGKMFSLLPWVKTIILSNSIGQFNLRDGGDIDFFIITSPRRIWLTRFFCAGLAALLNSRPKSKNKRDKICLSFYITIDSLNLDDLKLPESDPYFFYWLRSFILLYNKDGIYEKFLNANNLPNNSAFSKKISNSELNKRTPLFDLLENISKKLQFLIMSPVLKMAINNSVGVVINDKVLKLYLRDNRQEYLEKYGNKLKQVFANHN